MSQITYRKLTDRYKKAQYYDLRKIQDGVKAKLEDIIKDRLKKILEVKKFKPQNNTNLSINVVIGFDGAGTV